MSPEVKALWSELPSALGWHVVLSASALCLGLALSLPLILAAARSRRVRWPVLALASLVQTIPSLALLALFFPLLLVLSAFSVRLFGHGFAALGFLPALLALTLYSMLPILRNGVAGLEGLDPAVREAALGVGMTPVQRLILVEAPLAAPVAMAGVRTAAVWTIGTATLATPVGQTSLGDYIFSGLQTENWLAVLFGCAAAAALAFTADQLLALIETGLARRSLRLVLTGLLLCGLGVGGAAAMAFSGEARQGAYVLGAKNFSEQYILADLMRDRLTEAGARAEIRSDLGSAIAFKALAAGEIDAYVDYAGTLWTTVLGRTDAPPRAVLDRELAEALKRRYGVLVLGPLGFENAYALAMRADAADKLGVRSLEDLRRTAPSLTLGSDLEFLSRPEWRQVKDAYGLSFANTRRYQPTFLYRALGDGEADVVSAFSSDGRIAADRLRLLADPKGAIPSYDALILISPRRADDARLRRALAPLVGRIPLAVMQSANYAVDRSSAKAAPQAAAEDLARRIGLSSQTAR